MAIRVCIYRFNQSWQARINDPKRSGAYFNKAIVKGRTSEDLHDQLKEWANGKEMEVTYFDATLAEGDLSEGTVLPEAGPRLR